MLLLSPPPERDSDPLLLKCLREKQVTQVQARD